VNYPGEDVPFTRITEHKKFAPWEVHVASICSREFSSECGPDDTPFYPVNLAGGSTMLDRYLAAAKALDGYSFVGRLATFQYIDMDVAIGRARRAAKTALDCFASGTRVPAFFEQD
jgi:UDP-galactopyranose mutase